MVHISASTLELLKAKALPKGDVLTVAQIAGIMAAKRTSEFIPMCHPLALTHTDVRFLVRDEPPSVLIEASASTSDRTGVEMEALTALPLSTYEEKEKAAKCLLDGGAKAILLKGGHEEGDIKTDILFSPSDNGIQSSLFSSDSIPTRNIHGTGCTLSSAIAAYLAKGLCLEEAIAAAKKYISEAIRAGADIEIGHGFGPVNHGFNPLKMQVHVNP